MATNHALATAADPFITDCKTFDELLQQLLDPKRSHIRLVRLKDEGLVEATRKGSAFVMQPKIRVAVTALDYQTGEILRYAEKWEANSGAHRDPTGQVTHNRMKAALEARAIVVSEGEWTLESAKAALNH